MKTRSSSFPFSILDLATITEGATYTETFNKSLGAAQYAEKLGYNRYWLSEHHNMVSVASSATSVLIGYIASGTSKIRVGSGGIMLPNHSPLSVAEQFGTLEAIYPGRIDLGLGRAPGTDPLAALELRGSRSATAEDFPQNLLKLQTYFSKENVHSNVRAIPGEGQNIPIWILGSSTDSARLAAYLGLPYAFASHFAPAQFYQALQLYRDNFRPSTTLSTPYVMPCVNVIAADTDDEAERLATSLFQMFRGIITGNRTPLQPPVDSMDDKWSDYEETAARQMLQLSFIGSPAVLENRLFDFYNSTRFDEIMVISNVFDQKAKLHSYRLFSQVAKSLTF